MAEALMLDHSPFVELRNDIPLLRDVAYFQTGSLAPLTDRVRNETVRILEAEGYSALAGPGAYTLLHQESETHRARLAAFLGVLPSEIGWTTNTTTAVRHAIDSLTWQPGDILITTNREHISTRSLQDGLKQRHQTAIALLDASDGDDRFLCELEQTLHDHRTPRLLLISHVSCQDGRLLPVAEAIQLAHTHNVPVLVDGAQSIGQFPIDLRALGCDMLVGSAHKWLLGPAGLGFLYVAQEGLVSFSCPFGMASFDLNTNPVTHHPPIAASLELGTTGMAVRAGLATALDILDNIGLARIQEHIAGLTQELRSELETFPNLSLLSASEPDRSSGITSFAIDGLDHAGLVAIVSRLWESDRVMAKVQVEHPSIRISIAPFNNEEDISRLIRALRLTLTTPQV